LYGSQTGVYGDEEIPQALGVLADFNAAIMGGCGAALPAFLPLVVGRLTPFRACSPNDPAGTRRSEHSRIAMTSQEASGRIRTSVDI
jgi:hypothetical protein